MIIGIWLYYTIYSIYNLNELIITAEILLWYNFIFSIILGICVGISKKNFLDFINIAFTFSVLAGHVFIYIEIFKTKFKFWRIKKKLKKYFNDPLTYMKKFSIEFDRKVE